MKVRLTGLLVTVVGAERLKLAVGGNDSAAMVRVSVWVALGKVPLLAWTLKVNPPAVVGVPLSTPLLLKVSPAGSVPLATLHVIGELPIAVKLWLYALPTVPPAGVLLVMVGATVAALMVMVAACVALGAVPLAAWTVKV